MREKIPAPVLALLRRLHRVGFEAYPVGGCVRDIWRGVPPHDWDIAVSALPQQVEALFADCRVIETGLRHGTVTVLAGEYPVEITSFRGESGYTDGRRPDSVQFGVSLQQDLARRDFTIGAVAWDVQNDCLIDPYGGQQDWQARLLRAVGNPERRFAEDGLRILRGLRFAATLGLTVEPATAAALRRCAPMLRRIAPERVREELEKLLCGEYAAPVLREYIGTVGVVLPELLPMVGFAQCNPHHNRDVWEHTLAVLQNVPAERTLRWAALLHDVAKPQCCTVDEKGIRHFHGHQAAGAGVAEKLLRRLRCETRLVDDVTELIRIHDIRFEATEAMAVRWAGRWGERRFLQFLALRRADTLGQAAPEQAQPYYEAMLAHLAAAREKHACFTLRELAVNGEDLLALGYRGTAVGQALEALLHAVQEGRLPNQKAALLASLQTKAAAAGESDGFCKPL